MNESVRYKDLQLATLRSFCEVALSGNFTTAGKQLHLSTSTVWQQVRALERNLRVRLVRRQGRSVVLTREGKLLFELAQGHVVGLDSLPRLFESGQSDVPQQLIIASSPYLMSYHLPQPTQQYIGENPSIQIHFTILDWQADIFRVVARGEADLGVTVREVGDLLPPTLDCQEVFELPLALLTSSGHSLARKKKLLPTDLVKSPLIVPPPNGADAQALERILRRHNLTDSIRPVMETKHLEIIARYVALEVGIALCHMSLEAQRFLPGVHVREFDPDLEKLSAIVVVRKGAHLPPCVEKFRDLLMQCWGKKTNIR